MYGGILHCNHGENVKNPVLSMPGCCQLSIGNLLAEVRELMEWSRLVVLCARAHLQDRLNSLHVARKYEPPVPGHAHRIVAASV